MQNSKTEYQEAYSKGLINSPVNQIDGNNFVLIPEGCKVSDMENFEKYPRRIKENKTFIEVESFITYLKNFQTKETLITADPFTRKVGAIIDYHSKTQPEWCEHKVYFSPRLSKEWSEWIVFNAQQFSQADFLEFLEDHMENIKSPPGAEIMELCSSLEGTKNVNFKSGFKQDNGAINLKWEENFEATGSRAGDLKIPPELTLGISPFEKGTVYEIKAWLRYRIKEGKLVFFYKMMNPEKFIDDAFDEFLATIIEKTAIKPLLGNLENI